MIKNFKRSGVKIEVILLPLDLTKLAYIYFAGDTFNAWKTNGQYSMKIGMSMRTSRKGSYVHIKCAYIKKIFITEIVIL